MKHIFCVEDEKNIQELIKYNLEVQGYRVSIFDTGEELLQNMSLKVPDMFILDIMLPGIDGIQVLRKIKENEGAKNTPVIMLTAKNDELDKVLGLEMGADDYITKPFGIRELCSRVKALFRRSYVSSSQNEQNILKQGDIEIDLNGYKVYKSSKEINLTLKEFELLKILMKNKGKVLTRDVLLDKVWGFDYYGETRTVDVHIRYLRNKIEDDDKNPVYIETVRGKGYRFSCGS